MPAQTAPHEVNLRHGTEGFDFGTANLLLLFTDSLNDHSE